MIRFSPLKEFPWYLVSSEGYVVNADTGAVLIGSKKKTGYIEVCLRDENGNPHYRMMHRIVAQAFCENESCGFEVNHIDGDKENNNADNLEWISHGDNLKHAYENGLRDDDVSPRKVIATNIETAETIMFPSIYSAAHFLGISQGNICMCCKGKRPYAGGYYWEYVTENKNADM